MTKLSIEFHKVETQANVRNTPVMDMNINIRCLHVLNMNLTFELLDSEHFYATANYKQNCPCFLLLFH